MFRFRLGRIPVEVHFSHLLINLLFAWTFAEGSVRDAEWPGPLLRNTAADGHQATLAGVVLLWMLVISVSVLVHELGHALAGLVFGLRPTIHLLGMGGLTRANTAAEPLSWTRELVFTLAGPAFGLGLALLAGAPLLALHLTEAKAPVLSYVLQAITVINVFWTVLNLMPVPPLDGGQATVVVLQRLFGRPGFLVAQVVALVFSALLIAFGVAVGAPLVAMLFGLHGFRALASVASYLRGEQPTGAAAHPLSLLLEAAEANLREGKLSEAERIATSVLAKDAPPLVRAHAHQVLGVLHVKLGQGRAALDHFSQVQGRHTPPHFLAAAFSLVGDDARAVGLWEAAARMTNDPVIWHEFAGTLLRLGRELEVKRLPMVRMAMAWAAAQRVHFLRNEYEAAAHACEAAFREEPSSRAAYDAACAWARAGNATAALRMLTLAGQNGFADALEAESDPDLASLRERPEFVEWLGALPKKSPS